MSTPDSDLIRRCQEGDQDAWAALVERYGRLVYSVPRRYGLSDSDAEDVFGAVWAAVFRSLGQLRDEARLSSWLITMAHRETWRIGRKAGRDPRSGDFQDHFDSLASPSEDLLQRWEQQHLVRQALAELGGRCKDLLMALFLETGTPNYESIAQSLGMPIGSIGPTRSRCFKKLQKILLEMGYSEPHAEDAPDPSAPLVQ